MEKEAVEIVELTVEELEERIAPGIVWGGDAVRLFLQLSLEGETVKTKCELTWKNWKSGSPRVSSGVVDF